MADRFLTVYEASKSLDCSRSEIMELIIHDKIIGIDTGSHFRVWRIPESSIKEYKTRGDAMANYDKELNPPPEPSEEALSKVCAECPEEYHVNDLVDGLCPKCQPCGECGGSGCDECIEEMPKMPKVGIDKVIDESGPAFANFTNMTDRERITIIHQVLDPEIKIFKDTIVGLATHITIALANYAIIANELEQSAKLNQTLLEACEIVLEQAMRRCDRIPLNGDHLNKISEAVKQAEGNCHGYE